MSGARGHEGKREAGFSGIEGVDAMRHVTCGGIGHFTKLLLALSPKGDANWIKPT